MWKLDKHARQAYTDRGVAKLYPPQKINKKK